MMKILLIGSGARECALAWKFSQSRIKNTTYLWPGNAISLGIGEDTGLDPDCSYAELLEWSKEAGIRAVVCGPEQPLTQGLADLFEREAIPVFGPTRDLAMLEGSKAFAKEVMKSAGIPTADYVCAYSSHECEKLAREMLGRTGGVVLKASGLAGGKGVFVCRSEDDIDQGISRLFGSMSSAAKVVVVEEILSGRECSYFTFLGDHGATSLEFAVDFKRLKDGDQGPNTGGMGCYTPVEWLPANAESTVNQVIIEPLLSELSSRGLAYRGCLYVGLMWSDAGPKVVEFNVRLGDPECQALCLADQRDWLRLILEKLAIIEPVEQETVFNRAVCVVLASSTYPYGEGNDQPANLNQEIFDFEGGKVFGASVTGTPGNVKTGKGRVLSVVARGKDFAKTRALVYGHIPKIITDWPSSQYRKDIAELAAEEENNNKSYHD